MPFEIFECKGSGRKSIPSVSITTQGRFRFSMAFAKKYDLKNHRNAEILIDKKRRQIGFRFSKRWIPNAHAIRMSKTRDGVEVYSFTKKTLFDQCGWMLPEKNTSYDVKEQAGLVVINHKWE